MVHKYLQNADPEVAKILAAEEKRQQDKLSMIPSENFASKAVREAVGSVFMHKYSEGYPNARYYEGNYNIDALELLAQKRAKQFFKLPKDWEVNVQPLSGSPANLAVYLGLLKPGDKIMGMYLPDGGHLSHGWSYEPDTKQSLTDLTYTGGSRKVNISSKIYKVIQYKTDPATHMLNYDEVEKIAEREKPQIIITGGTAYPREIDYKRMSEIAHKVGAYYMADVAHEAGLIGGGAMKSPVGYADVVTLTTHKTFRGPRGAMILARADLMKKINRAIFPGLQGGPHNHSIAGIAVALKEGLSAGFKKYAVQVVKNARALAKDLQKFDFEIVSGGTDKHLILINLTNKGIFGKKFARALDYAGIVANYNTMPQEQRSPADPSALRLGTPWVTTRGLKEKEMTKIAAWMNRVMQEIQSYPADLSFEKFEAKVTKSAKIKQIAAEVKSLTKKFPLDI